MNNKGLLFFFLLSLGCLACHKDNDEASNKTLLQGTWHLQSSITKTSITYNHNGATNPPTITSDTILAGTAYAHADLTIEGDSMSYNSYISQKKAQRLVACFIAAIITRIIRQVISK